MNVVSALADLIQPTAPALAIDENVRDTLTAVEFPQEPAKNQLLSLRANRISKADLVSPLSSFVAVSV